MEISINLKYYTLDDVSDVSFSYSFVGDTLLLLLS